MLKEYIEAIENLYEGKTKVTKRGFRNTKGNDLNIKIENPRLNARWREYCQSKNECSSELAMKLIEIFLDTRDISEENRRKEEHKALLKSMSHDDLVEMIMKMEDKYE